MDVDLTWSDAARQAAIAARQAKAQGRAAQKRNQTPPRKQGTAIVPAGQKLPKLNDRQREGIDYRDRQNNGRVTNKRAGAAIAAFQKAHGLVVTGDLNPATRKLAAQVAKKANAGSGHHLLARAVHQIGRAKDGKNWKQNEKRAGNLLVKHDKRMLKRKLSADLSNDGKFTPDIDLGKDGSKWKHGYVPLNPAAAALKAHKKPGSGVKPHPEGVRGARADFYIAEMKHGKNSDEYHAALATYKKTIAADDAANGISDADKIKNAEKMYGTNSPQHLAAKKKFGPKKGSFYHGPKSRNSSN